MSRSVSATSRAAATRQPDDRLVQACRLLDRVTGCSRPWPTIAAESGPTTTSPWSWSGRPKPDTRRRRGQIHKEDPLHAHIPVILLSARGQEDDRERGLALGAIDFITKPYSPSDLLRRIREVLSEN